MPAFVVLSSSAAEWEDPLVNAINREPARSYSMPLASVVDALTDALEPETPYKISLNGDWKFHWCGEPAQRPLDFWKTDFDDSAWDVIDVPSCVEMRGYKSDVRWATFATKRGKGVKFNFLRRPEFVQALHYSMEDLEFARHRNGQERQYHPLVPREEICLNLDPVQMGLGGASCGPRPMDRFRPKVEPVEWSFMIAPR